MDERKIKRHLIRVAVISVVCMIALYVIETVAMQYVLEDAHQSDHVQMEKETEEYKERILKQMDKNWQILDTLGVTLWTNQVMDTQQLLEESLVSANKANSFITLAYMDKKGKGAMHTLGQESAVTFELEDCDPYVQTAMEQALQGERSVSKMFDSQLADNRVIAYCVPVLNDDAVEGVLMATDTMEIFEDIANGNSVMGGSGYVHIIGEQGDFLVRSQNSLVKENVNSIFDGPYLSEETSGQILKAISQKKSMFGEFEYNGEKCHFYLYPLGINGWSLFCAEEILGSMSTLENIIFVTRVMGILTLLIFAAMVSYTYYSFRKNTKLLLKAVYYDSVTGSQSIVKFDKVFEERTAKEASYSVVAVNIHNFKSINDMFGIRGGDKLLWYIRTVLEKHLKEREFFCRDSADLFYVFLLDTDENQLRVRMQAVIDQVFKVSQEAEAPYPVSLYCGIAVRGDRERALIALQSIRKSTDENIAFFRKEFLEEFRRKSSIEHYMRTALKDKEFKLFLQPKYDLKTDRLKSAEALVRWQKPDGTFRYPNEFIPLFEENGFCVKLDMYMVERACEQIRAWIDAGIAPIQISINQSKKLFSREHYVDELLEITERYGVSSSLIKLEILEYMAMDDSRLVSRRIDELHAKGFEVAMDDFGSGYSSLNMLAQISIDELKLDRGFLRNGCEGKDSNNRIILEQILSLAHKLGISTVAEGIETEEDESLLKQLGCECGQGYLYSRPISAQEFHERYMKKEED